MVAKDNAIFSIVNHINCDPEKVWPETVFLGYTKLVLMDEVTLCSLVPERYMYELDDVRIFMEGCGLDLKLVKSGLSMLTSFSLYSEENRLKLVEFHEFLRDDRCDATSVRIVKKALELAVIPMSTLFSKGHSLDDVFLYQSQMKYRKTEPGPKVPEIRMPVPLTKPTHGPQDVRPIFPGPKRMDRNIVSPNVSTYEKFQISRPIVSDRELTEPTSLLELAEKYKRLSNVLLDVVKGQEGAVLKFVQGCFQGDIALRRDKRNKPKSYFFFLGSPGTGKTLMATTAAKNMNLPYRIFNMCEYATSYSGEELKNALISYVRSNPDCILVFDEIEKAHSNVTKLFLQILGSGYMNVSAGDVRFDKAIIIFTSNVGKDLYNDRSVNLAALPEKVILNAIQNEKNESGEPVLAPELCSRIGAGNLILFNHLSIRHIVDMVNDSFEELAISMEALYDCHITYTDKLPLLFIYSKSAFLDGRIATTQSDFFLKKEVFELTRQLENLKMQNIRTIHFDIDWCNMDPELKQLFVNEAKSEVLILANELKREDIAFDENKYTVYFAENEEQAFEYLRNDITAVFVDPFFGEKTNNDHILSISDYNTEGIEFFRRLAGKETGIPIFFIEVDRDFSEVDKQIFLQEGVTDFIKLSSDRVGGFLRRFDQIMDEIYMENESLSFSQQGWVIDYHTRQDVSLQDGRANVLFYNLRKRMAIDAEGRQMILGETERPNVRFDDIIGAKQAKEELKFFTEYLKNPKKFLSSGGIPPKGVLLYGPPGTGKTMLAKAMAGESEVRFLHTSASEFKNKFVGESEANIRKIFAKARQYAPAILFIDEIDAIGKKRTGENGATESMLNALLTEMDGFAVNNKRPVFVLAATNFGVRPGDEGISSLDEALIRRFDNKIYVDLPCMEERRQYLTIAVQKRNIHSVSEETLDNIAERTTGQSLAILQNIVELAVRNAAKNERIVKDDDLLNSMEEYVYGAKKEFTPEHYKSVAIHETGHAYVAYCMGDTPSYITIEARSNFGGYMQLGNSEKVCEYTREELLGKIKCALAGRVAEQVFFGEQQANNTGTAQDLQMATHYATMMVCRYGMGSHLVTLDPDTVFQSPLAASYLEQINQILVEQMSETIKIVEAGKAKILEIATELGKRNHLTGLEFEELMG